TAVGMLAIALTSVPYFARSERLRAIIAQGQNATSQIMLRWSVVLLFLLLVIAARFGQDVVLGAMLAGIVLRGWTRRMGIDVHGLEEKFDAVGYGIFIPVFFVSSDDAGHRRDRAQPDAGTGVLRLAAGHQGPAVAADLPQGAAGAAAGRDDLHHRDRAAAARRARRDRAPGRQDAAGQRRGYRRRGRAVRPGLPRRRHRPGQEGGPRPGRARGGGGAPAGPGPARQP